MILIKFYNLDLGNGLNTHEKTTRTQENIVSTYTDN